MIKYRGEVPIRIVRNMTMCMIGYRTAIEVAIKNAIDGLIAFVTLLDMEYSIDELDSSRFVRG